MMEYRVRLPLKRAPTHPGELMREIIEDHLGISKTEAARRMQVSRPSLHAVLAGTSGVSADMALRFSRLAGGDPQLFLNMQTGYDLWHAQHRLAKTLREIEPVSAAVK
jgi:antitoxin HigA-1